jgi:hypothetical protein
MYLLAVYVQSRAFRLTYLLAGHSVSTIQSTY